MTKPKRDQVMVVESLLEIRHAASGTFLDIRGRLADYVRESGFLPHWKIDDNVVNFRDKPEKVEKEGAFVGYKSVGYTIHDAQTRNHFVDRATAFWQLLLAYKGYQFPPLSRFGARTKVFFPSRLSFQEINSRMYRTLFTDKAREIIGGTETDLQFVIELKDGKFSVRVNGGPITKGEAGRYFSFSSHHFDSCGVFLDIDYYLADEFRPEIAPQLLNEAVGLTWGRAERVATGLGL
jgi:hypothetical protein